MAKCTACRKQFPAPFWKYTTVCPECKSAQLELQANLKGITPALIVTPCLVGLNVLVFCLMAASGVSIMEPDPGELIKWGASFGALTLGPQPWRAVTSMFVHIGIVHLFFNMWCLWSLGRLAERLMGNWNFLLLYFLTGVSGSLVSLWLHPQLVCAGASGAIFGVAGGMVALLGLKKAPLPGLAVKQTFKSLLFFIGYNLLYGMRGGIDNAAHLGGLVGGAALGVFLPRRAGMIGSVTEPGPPPLAAAEEVSFSSFKMAGAALACVLALGFGFLRRTHGPAVIQAESTELELLQMGKEDRANLEQAAKVVESGHPDSHAIEKLQKVALHAPATPLPHMILAEAYSQTKQYDKAEDEFHKVLALQPNYAAAHEELGTALFQDGQYDQAIDECRAALRLDPHNANAHNILGATLEQKGDLKGALEEYRAACELDPKDATYQKNFKRLSKPVN